VNCGFPGSFSAQAGQVMRNMGAMCGTSDFFGVSIDARAGSRLQFGGGLDTGRTVLNNCYVTDSPQQLLYCRVVVPFSAQTQVKLHGSYALPRDVTVSVIFQNVGGPEIEANYPATNAAVAASLALAPKAPVLTTEATTGPYQGQRIATLTRGKSGYDALLKWTLPKPAEDLAGYAIVVRKTTAPDWEKEIFVGNVQEYVMENVSIDDVVFGVKAIDKEGNQSLVSTYLLYGSRTAAAGAVP